MPSKNLTIKFIFSICLCCLVSVSSQNTLRSGENLNFTSQLSSANRLFYLGFYTPSENTNNTYLAIQYNTSGSDNSALGPVWIGNRANPVDRNSNPLLSVQSSGRIIITRTGGQSIPIYSPPTDESIQNISATLTDTGNFVVESNGRVLWQSFDYPTDTLIPGMKLGFNRRTGRNWTISSWFSEDNPAPGPFTLEWDPIEGMLVIRRRGLIYWKSGQLQDYDSEWGKLKVFTDFEFQPEPLNFNYNFTNVTNQDENYFTFSLFQNEDTPEYRKVITGWRLDYKGEVRDTYSRPFIIAMASLCYGYRNHDTYKGCQLWEQPSCRNNREMFAYRSVELHGEQVDVKSDGNNSRSFTDCRETCWRECECFAFLYGRDYGCTYWRGNHFRVVQSLDGSSVQKYLLISSSNGMMKRTKIILIVVFSTFAVVVLCFGLSLFKMRKVKRGKRKEELHDLLRLDGYTENIELENSHDLRLFTYASIQSATSNFSSKMKLGQGGFGPVYKGKTREGQDIAVKVLSRQSGQGLVEFKTELILISKLQHVNLVKLIGCCIEGDEKMIVYDYMPNKSLDFFLFSPSKGELLDWPRRFNIIEGIAQGLLYLHKHSRLRIVHRDLKPSNILLDENMVPKISDFGLARIFKKDTYEANTIRCGGTYGYMAPEYAMQGVFSAKSDVYSFGVLVLEIVSGRKNNRFDDIEGPLSLVEYAWELWSSDSSMELMDPSLKDTCTVTGQVQKCIHVALLCVENGADDRPTIEDIVSILKTDVADLVTPKNPAFVTTKKREVKNVDIKLFPGSANELTISEMGGR